MSEKVVIGMSGGVDSSVAALILKEQGYDVIGITMNVWEPESNCYNTEDCACCGLDAIEDARRVAYKIQIPHYVVNFRDIFKKEVIDYFTKSYLNGITPNPCIVCNRKIKWEALLDKAKALGAKYIATGHYAKLLTTPNNRIAIASSDSVKDQSYALYNLTQEQLKNTIFPLSDYSKGDVRKLPEKFYLKIAKKPDSQDICFVPDGDYSKFIIENTDYTDKPGDFVDKSGNVIGKHKGIIHYTVGQRKGLNVSYKYPLYVLEINKDTNQIILGKKEDTLTRSVIFNEINFMGWESIYNKKLTAKIRYNDKGNTGYVKDIGNGNYEFTFDKPVRSPAPGQTLVAYYDNYIVFGGIIKSSRCE